MNRKKMTFFVMIAVIGIVSIIGGAYAFFAYNKEGTVENELTTGKITFKYDETSVRGINLAGALPIYDIQGSELDEEGKYFDFEISTEGTDQVIEYDILLSTVETELPTSAIKVLLSRIVDGKEETVSESILNGSVKTYDQYAYPNGEEDSNRRVILTDYFIPADGDTEPSTREYRLRIWLNKDLDFSPLKNEDGTYQTDENGNYIYPYNNKSVKVRVDVNATSLPYQSMGDVAENVCDNSYCDSGSTVTLTDGSRWTLIRDFVDSADQTVTLISEKYIDARGDYSDLPSKFSIQGETDSVAERLSNFKLKIIPSLSDASITVTLPSASMLGLTFNAPTDGDAYFLDDLRGMPWYNYYGSQFLLSDYRGEYQDPQMNTEKHYWYVENYKIKNEAYHGLRTDTDGDGELEYVSDYTIIKPVIIVSKEHVVFE